MCCCVRSDLRLVSATTIGGRIEGDLVQSMILVGSGAGSVGRSKEMKKRAELLLCLVGENGGS
jgi:hypothetical protein